MKHFAFAVALSSVLLLPMATSALSAQSTTRQEKKSEKSKDINQIKFRNIARNMPSEWYGSAEALRVADSVMLYQFPSGGWAKNHDWQKHEDRDVLKTEMTTTGIGSTIDNMATTIEMLFLTKVYKAVGNETYRTAFLKGLNYLFEAQYDNGGWPQYYPFKKPHKNGPDYSVHITYNDDAMINVMKVMRDIAKNKAPYDCLHLDETTRAKAQASFDKGISCVLATQIRKNGKLTVWCQQHDEVTLLPTNARAYELASFTGCGETSDLLELLMGVKNPSDELVTAVTAGVNWLKAHQINGMVLENFTNADGKPDRRLVEKKGAAPLWARYYDLETEQPYYCDRDGVKRPHLSDIGYERRNGYRWIDSDAQEVIDEYPAWLKKVRP